MGSWMANAASATPSTATYPHRRDEPEAVAPGGTSGGDARLLGAGRSDLHRDAAQHGIARERIDRGLVGEQVRVDAGMTDRDPLAHAGQVVAPSMRKAHHSGHHGIGQLDG